MAAGGGVLDYQKAAKRVSGGFGISPREKNTGIVRKTESHTEEGAKKLS